MKPTELKMLWKLVRTGEERPLSAADMTLLVRIRHALQDHADETKLIPVIPERRCLICGVPVSQCCC